MCGGSARQSACAKPASGLSPRVRGKPHRQRPSLYRAGSIPACAGEAGGVGRPHRLRKVYPRVCGGSRWRGPPSSVTKGLSPRVRGKRETPHRQPAPSGSIPACAGEAMTRLMASRWAGVYPRVCGGSPRRCPLIIDQEGLSPRVRGKPPLGGVTAVNAGSIPACAGEAGRNPLRWCNGRVYPRVCGGSFLRLSGGDAGEGLSPRVRGKPAGAAADGIAAGSIPACAGEAAPPPTR